MVYKKNDIVISASTRSDKSPSYQLILLIKKEAIVLVVLPTIAFLTNQVYLPIITFYYKLKILIIIMSIITKTKN